MELKDCGPKWDGNGYKVLRIIGGKLYSATFLSSDSLKSTGRTLYGELKLEPTRIVTPKTGCGPLCVFTDLGWAEHWMEQQIKGSGYNTKFVIYKCKYKLSTCNMIWYGNKAGIAYNLLPMCTRLCSAVLIGNQFVV